MEMEQIINSMAGAELLSEVIYDTDSADCRALIEILELEDYDH